MTSSLTPKQRTLRARAAAFALHAQGGTSTAAGTTAFLARFEAEVDPEGTLDPAERARRAMLARRSYMTRLALKASRARAKKKAGPDRDSGPAKEARHAAGERPRAA